MRVLTLLSFLALIVNAGLIGTAQAQTSTPAAAAEPAAAENADSAIPPMSLNEALNLFAERTGLQLVYVSEVVAGLETQGAPADLSPDATLRSLLRDTGLDYRFLNARTVTIASPEDLRDQGAVAGENTIGQRQPGIEEIIVTGQKREERIQDVPIAISAFSPEDLEAQKIEGGFDLLKGVPNVTFSKTNFTGYNFQIRGIGTQAVSATTDPGVAVSFNNTTLIVNRLFEQEYLDVERVEVLRGPQGTLFGRNATGGVINVISNKPELGVWDGMIDVEVGNYNTRRLRGFFNAPIGENFAIRGAYASTKRDGFGYNEASETNETRTFGDKVSADVDNRDLWTGRITLGWQPIDKLRFNLLWERFEEDDNRVRTSKQLCHRDPDDEPVGGQDPTVSFPGFFRADLSQGCKAGSLYSDAAFGTPNGASLPYISGFTWGTRYGDFFGDGSKGLGGNPFYDADPVLGPGASAFLGLDPASAGCDLERNDPKWFPIDLCQTDPYGGRIQSRDLRSIHSLIQPQYRASADIVELSWDLELTDNLLFSSQTVYADDEYYATQDYNRFTTFPIWNDSSIACSDFFFGQFPNCNPAIGGGVGDYEDGFYADLAADGVICDPQLGCSDSLVVQDLAQSDTRQYNQEFRLVSSFGGPWNFSLGANYTKFRTHVDYFVFSNAFTYVLNFFPFNNSLGSCPDPAGIDGTFCRYVDPTPLDGIIAGEGGDGHNYFRSANPYELTSTALFGELYWNATDTVKVTAGLRFTWDQKTFTPIPSQLLLGDYRELAGYTDGDPPSADNCSNPAKCPFAGNAPGGRGAPALPDIVQEWREPTGRLVVDWQPTLDFTDETMVYASFSHGYKGGGANPPTVAPPAGLVLAEGSGGAAPPTFEPEYINAYEIGTKNTLFNGALVLNGTAFYYDYTDYQVSKIVDRSAANENFDADVWGLELETVFAPSLNWQFNAAIGYLQTEIAEGERSIDLMDRAAGGDRHFAADPDATGKIGQTTDFPDGFDSWTVVKPWVAAASNCVVPSELIAAQIAAVDLGDPAFHFHGYCPIGNPAGADTATTFEIPYFDQNGDLVRARSFTPGDSERHYDPRIDAPNGGAGFMKDLSGNELPNAPHLTVALGGQYNFDLTRDWRATARVDYYWQDESYARVYNFEPYDRLKSWSNTNLSFWVTNPQSGITVEGYVKNVFDETPITGSFLNSDDTGLTTNVFTLDPRLIGVSIRKEF